ncbi:MAG: type II toxin-antitoxin system VapC family toxin [Nevskiales bacterium]
MKSPGELRGALLYLDSNVFIYAFEAQAGPLRQAIGQLLRWVYEDQCTSGTSLITRAEVLVRPLRMRQTELADRYRRLLSGDGPVSIHGLDEQTVDQAAELRADYPVLKLPDALHIATAVQAGCDLYITGDQRLGAVASRIPVLTLDQLPVA